MEKPASSREVSRLLSGYLCGTHSGVLALSKRRAGYTPERIAAAHRRLKPLPALAQPLVLGASLWRPGSREAELCRQLLDALSHDAVIELVLFGSQARGGVTGFSDVDAILVIEDGAAEDVAALSTLRSHVLAAQRAVLGYQPMQHHGFEVATPKLLLSGLEAVGLPASALTETSGLTGTPIFASAIAPANGFGAQRLNELARNVQVAREWPRHPWRAHSLIAMFELLPTLYLFAQGFAVSKAESFAAARDAFGSAWWPYDVLDEVRSVWPGDRYGGVGIAFALARNPWAVVAAWRHLPSSLPASVKPLLTRRCLEGLQSLARTMVEQAA